MKLILIVVLLSTAISIQAKVVKQRRLICQTDEDCTLAATGSCCGPDTAVNKQFAEVIKRPMNESCKDERHACPTIEAKCENSRCVVKEIPKSN